jgi:Phage gp6-like head-tail connector protein
MALDTLANVKTALAVTGTADDTLLTQLQTVADSFVETFCGRSFAGGTFTEYHSGVPKLIFLAHYPIVAITDIRVDAGREFDADTVMPADRYVVHKARGVIECLDGPFVPCLPGWELMPNAFPEAVKVIYTTATGSVPPPVCHAYAQLIGHWFRQAKTHAATGQLNVIEEPTANGPTVYPWGQSMGYSVPNGVKELLAAFRVPAM